VRRVSVQALVERPDRFENGLTCRSLVEEVEVQVVAVNVGDACLEPRPDQRIGVLADGDQEVRPQVATVDAAREIVVEPVVAIGLVEEVLLELVEDDRRSARASGHRATS
jgi:hypothetical protein